jgi:hypothetical protein
MKHRVDLNTLLSHVTDKDQQLASFALLGLGIVGSLAGGAIGASSAVRLFFHADNCLFVHQELKREIADEIMGRGVQLPDLFTSLPIEEAQRELQRELSSIRSLCLRILEERRIAA